MSKLLNYFNLLDQNATAREAHNQSPVASMAHYGLTTAEQQVVMSGDKEAIATLAGIDFAELRCVQVHNVDDTYFAEKDITLSA